ncbi:MAG: hypothetical protein Q9180_001731 [Flavoplaca navasiana]
MRPPAKVGTFTHPVLRSIALLMNVEAYISAPTPSEPSKGSEAKVKKLVAEENGPESPIYSFLSVLTREANELKAKKEYERVNMRREAKKQRDINFRELQERIQRLDPCFRPGEAAEMAAKEENRALRDLEFDIIDVVLAPKEKWIHPKIDSEDPIERYATRLRDPAQRFRLRAAWNKMTSRRQEDLREQVRNKMGRYGMKWPEQGNPIEGEDNEY